MRQLWEKVTDFVAYWHQALIVSALCVIMIGAVYFQSTIHETHTNYLERIHKLELDTLKQQQQQTIRAGDALFEVYQQERSNSEVKDQILEKQRTIIQDLLKRIEEYKKWENVDPRSIA